MQATDSNRRGGEQPDHPFPSSRALRASVTPGGGRVFVTAEPGPPLVRVGIGFHAGSLLDPPGKEGLVHVVSRMLTCGTRSLRKRDLEAAIDGLGGSVKTELGLERLMIWGESLVETWEAFVALLESILAEPVFPEEELGKAKEETKARLVEMRNRDRSLGEAFHERALFGPHPYGRPKLGTAASLDRITRDDVVEIHGRFLGENGALVAVTGPVDAATAEARARRLLAAAGPKEKAEFVYPARRPIRGRRVLLVDKPERSQTHVQIGHYGITLGDPDFPALDLANTAFGGDNSSAVLYREIREKRGWSYGAESSFKVARQPHSFAMAFAPAVKDTAAAIELSLALFDRFVSDGVDPEALEFSRRYTLGSAAFEIDTPDKRMKLAMDEVIFGFDQEAHLEAIRTLSGSEVDAAIRRHLDPENLLITVVCTAADLRSALERVPGVTAVDVEPYDTLG